MLAFFISSYYRRSLKYNTNIHIPPQQKYNNVPCISEHYTDSSNTGVWLSGWEKHVVCEINCALKQFTEDQHISKSIPPITSDRILNYVFPKPHSSTSWHISTNKGASLHRSRKKVHTKIQQSYIKEKHYFKKSIHTFDGCKWSSLKRVFYWIFWEVCVGHDQVFSTLYIRYTYK